MNGPSVDITDFDAWLSAFEQETTTVSEQQQQMPVNMGFTAPLPLLPPNLGGADLSDLNNTDWDAVSSVNRIFD
jgi:hypothetical protein